MRCTLIVVMVLLVLVSMMVPASAQLTDKEALRDLPNGVLALIPVDPDTGIPLKTDTPEGPKVVSANATPVGAGILVNPVVDLGERWLQKIIILRDMAPIRIIEISYGRHPERWKPGDTVWVKVNRQEQEVKDLAGWLEDAVNFVISTSGQKAGRWHSVQLTIIRRDVIWVSLLEKYWLDNTTSIAQYRPKPLPSEEVSEHRGRYDDLMPAKPGQLYNCLAEGKSTIGPNGQPKMYVDDWFEVWLNGQLTGLVKVTGVQAQSFQVELMAGSIVKGADLYPVEENPQSGGNG